MTGNNIVVYTAIFDDYDELLQPAVTPDNVDFVCFTDDESTARGVWEARLISDYDLSPKLMSGMVKVLAHRFFPEYEYSVWVDGNVHVIGDVRELIRTSLEQANMAVPPHPDRNCVYDEADACIELGLAEPKAVRAQMQRYRAQDFLEDYGLSETRVLVRRHNQGDVVETMETWWEEYQKGADRDQLSFEFAAYKCELNYVPLHLDYESHSGYFHIYHYYHKPSGLKGDIWGFLLRGFAENSGNKARFYTAIFNILVFANNVAEGFYHRTLLGNVAEVDQER